MISCFISIIFRLYGCSENVHGTDKIPESDDSIQIFVEERQQCLTLPPRLKRISDIPSLHELSLRAVYGFLRPKLTMKITCTDDVHMLIPSLMSEEDGSFPIDDLKYWIPCNIAKTLSSCPTSFCCHPVCCGPIFTECFIQVQETDVQRSWLGGGQLEMKTFLATKYFCGLKCYLEYVNDSKSSAWKMDFLKRTKRWTLKQ